MVNEIFIGVIMGYMIFAVIFYVVFLILREKQEWKEYKWRQMDDKVTEKTLDIMKKNRKDMLDGM